MKTKAAVSNKKQTVTVKDLKTKKNPKGGSRMSANEAAASGALKTMAVGGGGPGGSGKTNKGTRQFSCDD